MNKTLKRPITSSQLHQVRKILKKYDFPDLMYIHGFITAIISSPYTIMPSKWMDLIGFTDVSYKNEKEARLLIDTVMLIYDNILHQLRKNKLIAADQFFQDEDVDQESAKKNWSQGYLYAVSYDLESWLINDEISTLLSPILSMQLNKEGIKDVFQGISDKLSSNEVIQIMSNVLSEAANDIFNFWKEQKYMAQQIDPMMSIDHKQGRNEPCPCGSGKKYKKCCLTMH
ncbi:UPF0149 family protein [Gammaproteobacteria bacterium]|nr:UPF0149 family protein [Gammaproteobacteria bacterium]